MTTIYFAMVLPDGPVKIGCSHNVRQRITALQTQNKCKLAVIRELRGNRDTEERVHAYFKLGHLGGEWFKYHPDMLTIRRRDLPRGIIDLSKGKSLVKDGQSITLDHIDISYGEREAMRAKWRLAKQRQRQLRTREGPGHMTW